MLPRGRVGKTIGFTRIILIKVVALIIPCYSISKSICNSCSYNIRHVMVSPTEVMLMCTRIILILCSFMMMLDENKEKSVVLYLSSLLLVDIGVDTVKQRQRR